ncbi:phosphotransferase enzyme family protein [Tritonibacter horizontis]|uniref:Phosphotransferase enzyme family protein n=2 Tax=Tritonibacter horizontis TaxID=1768241 RepID=A0A132C3D4_9RHOB|nr:phosphotransferase enzyme family protein [Tritonibacter horizontis]
MVPRYVAHGYWQNRDWLIYTHLAGGPWTQDTAHVARLLGILHDQAVFAGLPDGVNGSVALEAQTEAILAVTDSAESAELMTQRPLGRVPETLQTGLIHGDPVPGNLMVHDGTLALIDWQCPQRGDPAEDLALFLSPAMQLLYRGRPLSALEETEFVAAYPDRRVVSRYFALKPWFHWRMAAYCLWRNDRRALALERAALQSIRPRTA